MPPINWIYETVKGITAVASVVGLVFLGVHAEDRGLDGALINLIVVLVAALGGIYVSDIARRIGGQ